MSKIYLVLTAVFFSAFAINSNAQQWRPVSGSRQANISGMALIRHEKKVTTILVVHDNKKKEQVHATIITVAGTDTPLYTPLKWPGDNVPVDLEAVTAVPGAEGQFIALNADGHAYHFKINLKSNEIEVIKAFDVPMIPAERDFEGFVLQKINNTLVAVWAERGGGTAKPATIFWSKFDLDGDKFTDVSWAPFRVPYPVTDVRHIADLKVDATGAVFVVSASDPGNDGPFSSAFYFAGVLSVAQDKIIFTKAAMPTRLFSFDYHKVEAFEFVPGADGGLAFGTDDENLGAALLLTF